MRKTVKDIFCFLGTFLITVIVLNSLNTLFVRKDSISHYKQFYDADYDFDIIFLGNSHTLNAISPLDLWNEYGFSSYNLSTPGTRFGVLYWIMENAFTHNKPKLVVINCAYIYIDEKIHPKKEYNHKFWDYLPTGITKFKTAFDLYSDNWRNAIYEIIFPFSIYHNRWDELTQNDFYPNISENMGFLFLTAKTDIESFPKLMSDNPEKVDNIGTQYLRKMIEKCQAENIDVLLTFMPFNVSQESQNDAAYLADLASEYGIKYINPEEIIPVLDLHTDFANNIDDNSHVNLRGALKITDFLGEYISNYYSLPDHREEPDYQIWNTYYEKYYSTRENQLEEMNK